jgi:hypothetical protein
VLAYVFGRRQDEVFLFSMTERMHELVIELFINRYEFGLLL